jgi:hypothetical protein
LRNAYRRSSCMNKARQRHQQSNQFQRCRVPAGAQNLMIRSPPEGQRSRRQTPKAKG